MPHVDELLGPATLAAAGLVVAIALQPVASRHAGADAEARVTVVPAVASADRAAAIRKRTEALQGPRPERLSIDWPAVQASIR